MLLLLLLLKSVALALRVMVGSWQYYHERHCNDVFGWIYVQGCWSWGNVLTWHAEMYEGENYWVCYLWKWDYEYDCWTKECLQNNKFDHEGHVEDWMLRVTYPEHYYHGNLDDCYLLTTR